MTDILQGLIGLMVLIAIAVAASEDRGAIRLRVVLSALGLQAAIGALVLFVPWGRTALGAAASAVNRILAYGNRGTEFLFGALASTRMTDLFGDTGFVFAFRVLPAIIYVSALIGVLYYLGTVRIRRSRT